MRTNKLLGDPSADLDKQELEREEEVETLRGYSIKQRKGLSHWSGRLEEWLLAVERYCRVCNGEDAPYFYNERANIGVLAGASWRSGWIVLEEFQSEKGYRNKPKVNGRVDLWLSDETREELVEAKFRWICMDSPKTNRLVEKSMLSALKDAKGTRCNSRTAAFGVGFFPVYKSGGRVSDIDELITKTIEQFCKLDYHALAWCFPKEVRNFQGHTGNILPGVFMLVKNLDY